MILTDRLVLCTHAELLCCFVLPVACLPALLPDLEHAAQFQRFLQLE